MTPPCQALLADLDAALPQASASWRSAALRQIVDLFVVGAPLYSGEQVALFDAVIERLMADADRAALADMSRRLAPIDNAPVTAIRRLARHADPAVCGPVLERATALSDADLVEIADKDAAQAEPLKKIALRPQLSAAVTDVLLKRGGKAIRRSVIDNPNARLSEAGFARLVMSIDGDKDLAAAIAARDDVPPELQLWLTKALSE